MKVVDEVGAVRQVHVGFPGGVVWTLWVVRPSYEVLEESSVDSRLQDRFYLVVRVILRVGVCELSGLFLVARLGWKRSFLVEM